MPGVTIRAATLHDEKPVVGLWHACDLVVPTNDPAADFRFAAGKPNSEVLVGVDSDQQIIGSIMVGHDGHRGWVYYVAVAPGNRKLGIGRSLVEAAEHWLQQRGLAKINLMVRETNARTAAFYQRLGYDITPRINLQKRLKPAD